MTLCNYHVVNGRGERIYQYLGSLSAKWTWLKRDEEGRSCQPGVCVAVREGLVHIFIEP